MSENALALARQHAPCYIYSREILTAQAETLHRTFPGFDILFSVKVNPFPPVIRHLAALGIGADAASAGEIRLAAECGIAQEDIYFSAAGKSDRALAAAWDNCHLIADSIGEVRRIAAMAAARGETKAIGLRVNPAFSMDGGTGGTSKFGIDESDLPALKTLLQTLPIAVCGLHIHLRSQNLSADTLARYYKNCFALALRVRDILDCAIEYINFGGGVGIVYDPACQPPLNMSTLKQCTQAVAEENARTLHARLLVESGRFLTAQAGTYYLPVVDKKTSHGTTYVIAVAASNKEVYSEVKSIEMATDKDLSGPAVFDRQVAGGYYGIPEGGRYGEYLVILADGEAVGADGVYATIGAGRTMSLNLYQFAPTNMNNIVLPDRTYKYATDKSISTFHPAKTYCMVNDGKGNITKVEFKAGTIAVTKSGSTFTVKATLTTTDDKEFTASYTCLLYTSPSPRDS